MSTSRNLRCVSSSGPVTVGNYTDNGDGTISDASTGLRWQKCAAGRSGPECATGTLSFVDWDTALDTCESLSLGSFANSTEWRLPNINELNSLLQRSVGSAAPAIDTNFFPQTGAHNHWTSTTFPLGAIQGYAFATYFSRGGYNGFLAKTGLLYSRCVATDAP